MSIITKFLQLFEYDPETDGASTFNIPKALNENWDKIDAWSSGIKDTIAGLVPSTRKINKKPLSADVTLTGEDIKVTGSDETTICTRLSELTNPNLLDNWYFVGGGETGQFPINQRGRTEYTGDVYGIDRWRGIYGGEKVTLKNSWSSFEFSGNQGVKQEFDKDVLTLVSGNYCTISIIWRLFSGSYANFGVVVNGEAKLIPPIVVSENFVLTSLTLDLSAVSALSGYMSISGDGVIDAIACKLEVGRVQTLAHQENGKWVLNEIPDYGEQLARCQRYLLDITPNIPFNPSYIGSCVKDKVTFSIPTPVTLRAAPVFIGDATKIQIVFGDSESYIASNARTVVSGSGFCTILCTIAGNVAEGNRVCDFRKIDETARFLLSAEL